MEGTITQQEMDATSTQFVQSLRADSSCDFDPDLSVDGLSESLISSLIRILTFRRPA